MEEKRRVKSVRFVGPELILGGGMRVPILQKEPKKFDGEEYIRFSIKPTDRFLQKYNLPYKPYYIKDFKKHLVIEGDQDPHTIRATFVAGGWNGEPTALMNWEDALLKELGETKNKNALLKFHNFRLRNENRKLMTRPQEISDGVLKNQMKWKGLHGKEVVYDKDNKGEYNDY